MSTFRYVAVPRSGGARRSGEMAGRSAADVRASLRRIGFQVIEIAPVRSTRVEREAAGPVRAESRHAAASPWDTLTTGWRMGWLRHVRGRRRIPRADLADSLATMLDSGMPMLDAVGTLLESEDGTRSARRTLLVQLRDDLAGGRSVAEAVRLQPGWFDDGEAAMVEAGQRRGELAAVLRNLAGRHERSEAIAQRLVGALVYPTVVLAAGVGVAVFLGTRTLPELAGVLEGWNIQVPAATRTVMLVAGFVVDRGWLLLLGLLALIGAGWSVRQVLRERQAPAPPWLRRLTPRTLRRAAVGSLCRRLAELIRTGVPVEEAMRVTAPTLASSHLRECLRAAARDIERGRDLSAAFDDPLWFDAEFRRLVDIGQAGGELDGVLDRIGRRYERQSVRAVDRLLTLLEPAVIILLAAVVGVVVMAAILPFLRLQEILA